ncbi:MAG TPA: DHHA1 domain-containing protein, partial [Nitrospirota bacterium]|nr:DHHA1 domain-containing protein [Nitrospirota bacterium]
ELLEQGVDPWMVTQKVYESYEFTRLKLMGHVFAGVERNSDGRIAWVVVTEEHYRRTGTSAEDTEDFVNFVRSINGVEVAVLFRQTGANQYKVSLRSKGRIDLSDLAKSLGGGGHRNASGCVLDGSFEEVRRTVIETVEAAIKAQLGA